MAQLLFRKETGKDADYQLLTRFDNAKNEFLDNTVLPRHEYHYAIKSVYFDGGESPLSAFAEVVR